MLQILGNITVFRNGTDGLTEEAESLLAIRRGDTGGMGRRAREERCKELQGKQRENNDL